MMIRSALAFRVAILLLGAALSGCADKEEAKRRHLEQGNAHLAAGRTQEAIIEYRNAIKLDRRFGDAHLKLGEAYAQSRSIPQAAKEFIIAAELLPNRVDAQLRAATVRLLAEDFQGARMYAEAALKLQPKDVAAQVILANSLAGLKELPAALKQLEEAIALSPGDARPYTSLGAIRIAQGDRALAEDAFRKAIAAEPKSSGPRLSLGYFLWTSGRAAEAEAEFKQALALNPDDPIASRISAMFYISHNKPSEAETPLLRLANRKDDGAMQMLADLYIRAKRFDKARPLLETLTEKKSTRTFAVTRLASLDYDAGKKEQAHKAVETILAEDENNPDLLALQARWFAGEGRMDDALAAIKKAVAAAPESPLVQYTLGLVHEARSDSAEAIRAFTETLRLNPRATAAELQLSRLLLLRGEIDQGLARARSVVRAAPDNVDGRVAVATALIGKGDLASAEAEVKALLKEHPQNASVHSLNGHVLARRGDAQGAMRALDRALELNPANLHALDARLAVDLHFGRVAEARARMQRALAGRVTADLLVLAARMENTAKDSKAAEKYLRQAIDLGPDDIKPYYLLGQMYVRENRLDEARREFEEVVRRRADAIPARTMVGIILEAQGKTDESRKVYEGILSNTSRAPVVANNLAYMYAEGGDRLNEALALAQTAHEQMPDSPEISDTLGWVYYKKDMAQLAIRPLQLSVDKDPKNPIYRYHLGLAYAKAGQATKAKQELEQALKLNANFPGAADARATLGNLKIDTP